MAAAFTLLNCGDGFDFFLKKSGKVCYRRFKKKNCFVSIHHQHCSAQLKAAVRQEVIGLVLATDMKQHFALMGMFASKMTPSRKLHTTKRLASTRSSTGGSNAASLVEVPSFFRNSTNTVTAAGALATRASAGKYTIIRAVSCNKSAQFSAVSSGSRSMNLESFHQPPPTIAEDNSLVQAAVPVSNKPDHRRSVPSDEVCQPQAGSPLSPILWDDETTSLVLKVRVKIFFFLQEVSPPPMSGGAQGCRLGAPRQRPGGAQAVGFKLGGGETADDDGAEVSPLRLVTLLISISNLISDKHLEQMSVCITRSSSVRATARSAVATQCRP